MFAAPAIHQLDGKYRVLAQLGQGGTANVSLAALRGPSGFNKLVVLKSMKHALKAEPEFARMFMTEARLRSEERRVGKGGRGGGARGGSDTARRDRGA